MEKGKLLGLSNTPYAMWYKFSPEDSTLKLLDEIFDLYDHLFDETIPDLHGYKYHLENGELHFHYEKDDYVAYFIFTTQVAHVILQKTKEWKRFAKKIDDNFIFIE